ncbi:MAG: DUF4347 domain-containing protein, partial [Gammaproteobacteria bacterium]|nr:DUF4347 domain-containing protein [Gammaproteobacteria bacterium]
WLDHTTLSQNAEAARAWGDALGKDGDIFIAVYNYSLGNEDLQFIDTLGELTGAKIIAADGPTDREIWSGDANLEHTAGSIEPADPIADNHSSQNRAGDRQEPGVSNASGDADPVVFTTEILFIDTAVKDNESLLAGIKSNVEIVYLDPNSDGVEQIAEALDGRSGIEAIHLIAEGNAAELHLGDSFLTQKSISGQYADLFYRIGNSLSENADLLIYGCNFGQGEEGMLAMESLARLTGADIAASVDRTGHINEYGDWELEVNTGQIESSIVISEDVQATWEEAMATYTVSNTNDSGAGSLRQAIIDANANSGTDNIHFDISAALVGGAHTISLLSALPDITETVIIDGTQDSDFAGTPIIVLDGSSAG